MCITTVRKAFPNLNRKVEPKIKHTGAEFRSFYISTISFLNPKPLNPKP